jgi:gluconate 5-dehydrogenase
MSTNVYELMSLKGKVAIVTGGAGYLGSEMVESLAEANATVAVVDISNKALDNLKEKLSKKNLKIETYECDAISDENEIRGIIDKIASKHNRLDVLVNCAVSSKADLIDKLQSEHFKHQYKNSTSYFIMSQQAFRYMRETGGGSIINIASMYGVVTGYPQVYEGLTPPNPLPYQADKAAVLQMTRHTAVYWAKHNIRVNAISPGPFPNTDKAAYKNNPKTEEFIKRLNNAIPLGRSGKPEELKGAVLFLASDASSFVTGQNILVDGGFTTW